MKKEGRILLKKALLLLIAIAAMPVAGVIAAQAQTPQLVPTLAPPLPGQPRETQSSGVSPPLDQSAQRQFRQIIASRHSVISIQAASCT